MGKDFFNSLLFIVVGLSACETSSSKIVERSAQSEDLRKETMVGVALPAGCPTITTPPQSGKSVITVSYLEPTTDHKGNRLGALAYTTIYVSSPDAQAIAIRVYTKDARGGASVTVRDIPIPTPGQEVGICVTATDWANNESSPASLDR